MELVDSIKVFSNRYALHKYLKSKDKKFDDGEAFVFIHQSQVNEKTRIYRILRFNMDEKYVVDCLRKEIAVSLAKLINHKNKSILKIHGVPYLNRRV